MVSINLDLKLEFEGGFKSFKMIPGYYLLSITEPLTVIKASRKNRPMSGENL